MADADLVLEGGGVKGIGLAGALSGLTDAADAYRFHRIAGTSAGAIVASMVAAGYDADALRTVLTDLDFARFEDPIGARLHLRAGGEALGLIFRQGLFRGEYLHRWIVDTLAARGVHTWADLRDDDPGSALPPEQRYKLIVIVSDISRGRMLRLPWDYRSLLGVDPDDQPVADAVRASAGIPFFFRPFRLAADPAVSQGRAYVTCTDGGMLSNFPVSVFDRTDGRPPRWPTFGVKLSARRPITDAAWTANANTLQLAKSLLGTLLSAHDRVHVDDPSVASRTVFVDTTGVSSTDFHLDGATKERLFENGRSAATKFLTTWDWTRWRAGDYVC